MHNNTPHRMSRTSNIITLLLLLFAAYSCPAQDNSTSPLHNWQAGTVVSPEAVEAFGIANAFVATEITDDIYSRIYGKSFKADCTTSRDDLRYLKLLHYDIDGNIRLGELICHKSIATDLVEIFRELYKAQYPIEKMRLIDEYNASDDASMRDNNSSAFNYRVKTAGKKLSKHALGLAIDINPLYNPYVRTKSNGQQHIAPENAAPYADRSKHFHYKIDSADICCKLFKQYGFKWGGDWKTIKDYQHFEK